MLENKEVRIITAVNPSRKIGRLTIGHNGDMPWRGLIPSDMERFQDLTKKGSVVMGSKTFWSIPEKFRPFDKGLSLEESRQTIVITRKTDLVIPDPRVVVVNSLLEAAKVAKSEILWIGGGAEIYALALPFADFIHRTLVFSNTEEEFPGDTFFPECDLMIRWSREEFEQRAPASKKAPNDKLHTFYEVWKRKKAA